MPRSRWAIEQFPYVIMLGGCSRIRMPESHEFDGAVTPTDLDNWKIEFETLCARFEGRWYRTESREHFRQYLRGLLAPQARKNSWTISEFTGERKPTAIQRFINLTAWDADGLRDEVISSGQGSRPRARRQDHRPGECRAQTRPGPRCRRARRQDHTVRQVHRQRGGGRSHDEVSARSKNALMTIARRTWQRVDQVFRMFGCPSTNPFVKRYRFLCKAMHVIALPGRYCTGERERERP